MRRGRPRTAIPARVKPGPDGWYVQCPDEPWFIWVHTHVRDFEWDSFGASAGHMLEGAEVTILKTWSVLFKHGPMEGERLDVVKVRGPNLNGRQITGWALARDFETIA